MQGPKKTDTLPKSLCFFFRLDRSSYSTSTTGLAKSPAPVLELGPEIELGEKSCNLLPTNLPCRLASCDNFHESKTDKSTLRFPCQ